MSLEIDPFYRGDTVEWKLTFKTELNQPIDITGMKIYLTLKESKDDADSLAPLQLRFTPPLDSDTTAGIFWLQLESDLTELLRAGRYYGDIQTIKTDGVVCTYDLGTIRVKKDLTRNR